MPVHRIGLYYILDEHNLVVPVRDVHEWGKWFEEASRSGRRIVAQDETNGLRVSTVFLGMDLSVMDERVLTFETMVFRGASFSDLYMKRYETWADAVAGHADAIEWCHSQETHSHEPKL